jgi:3-oxoacyl-[acyl-carrier-protein] synthase III
MAQTVVHYVALRGVSTCVTRGITGISDDQEDFSNEELQRIIKLSGVKERHLVGERICTSDLCEEAARRLLMRLEWPGESIDLLVFVSQTPDYFMPSTACILQHKLGLSVDCAAFDVNMGCSGFPYGLSIVSKMMQGTGIKRALLLVGETPSKICHVTDRSTRLIFGDAGSATALEVDSTAGPMGFALHTDGGGKNDFIVRAGGFRDRFAAEEHNHYIEMNGPNIFAFTMQRVPSLAKDALSLAEWTTAEVDYFAFHQANAFIIEHLRKKVDLPKEKVPLVIDRFGNTGGCSVPLALTQGDLQRPSGRPLKLVLLAFGVGLSWASATLELEPSSLLFHTEVE